MSNRHQAGPVVIEIENILPPATFSRLPDAVAALWESLRELPLGWTQYEAYRGFFGAGAVERISEFLNRDGKLTLSFALADRTHEVRIHSAETKSGGHQ